MLPRKYLNVLYQFMCVADYGSFTKAANQLGVTQASISKQIRELEKFLGYDVLNRTTRKVFLTQRGKMLYEGVKASYTILEEGLSALNDMGREPKGTVRINASRHLIDYILTPKLAKLAKLYPLINIEFFEANGFVDLLTDGFDAGVRLENQIPNSFISLPINNGLKMVVVGSPAFFARDGFPKSPDELEAYPCLAYRFQTNKVWDWEFIDPQDNRRRITHAPKNSWTYGDPISLVNAARLGVGLAYVPLDLVEEDLNAGRLVQVLPEYGITLPKTCIYYSDRRVSHALRVILDALKLK